MSKPEWCPPLLDVSGPREEAILRLYRVFAEDFKNTGCTFRGLPVQFSRCFLAGDLHEHIFWHLISKDGDAEERYFDSCRSRRLSWCKAVVEHAHEDEVTVWKDYVGKALRTYLWLEAYDYAVVLEEGIRRDGPVVFLVTAYCVEDRVRKRLKKSYRRRVH